MRLEPDFEQLVLTCGGVGDVEGVSRAGRALAWPLITIIISIIKKYPKGLGNRMRKFDEWTLTANHPQVKTYYDYFYNLEGKHF